MDLFKNIAASVADLIAADPYFWEAPPVPVYSAWALDKARRTEIAAGKLSGCVVVGITEASFEGAHLCDPPRIPVIKLQVLCLENTALAADKTADNMALAAAGALVLGLPDPAMEIELELNSIRPMAVSEFPVSIGSPENWNLVCLEVTAEAVSNYAPETASAPVLSISAGYIDLSGPPEAEIYYTLDGSIPTNITGQLYNCRVAVTETFTIRARAYVTGQRASLISTLTIP